MLPVRFYSGELGGCNTSLACQVNEPQLCDLAWTDTTPDLLVSWQTAVHKGCWVEVMHTVAQDCRRRSTFMPLCDMLFRDTNRNSKWVQGTHNRQDCHGHTQQTRLSTIYLSQLTNSMTHSLKLQGLKHCECFTPSYIYWYRLSNYCTEHSVNQWNPSSIDATTAVRWTANSNTKNTTSN